MVGDAAYRRFIAVFAGTAVTFPKHPRGAFFATLARVIGPAVAERVRVRFAGESIYITMNLAEQRACRNEEISARIEAGEPHDAVARAYHTTVRHVRRIAASISRIDVKARGLG